MPDVNKLVVRTKAKLEFAPYTGSTLGTFIAVTPRGSVQVSDQRGTQTYADFSSALGAFAAQTADGDRTASLSFTAFLIPSDATFQAMLTAYENNDPCAFRVRAGERVGTEVFVRAYQGFLNNFSYTLNQDGAAEVSIAFVASSRLPAAETITP